MCVICSIFYEKEGFYCLPKELPLQEFGGVAVALGQKVSSSCAVVAHIRILTVDSMHTYTYAY